MAEPRTSTRTYYLVTAALMLLLVATVGVSFLSLGRFGPIVAMSIAFLKAGLIVLIFMHVRYGSGLVKLFAAAGFFWVVILFLLAFSDYVTRS